MNPVLIELLLAGAGVGAGLWMLLLVAVPERTDLVTALQRPRRIVSLQPLLIEETGPGKGLAGLQERVERRLARLQLNTPDRDLAVAGISRGRFLLIRVAAVLGALLCGQVYSLVLLAFGLGIPIAIPQLVFVIVAVVAWFSVGLWVRELAANRRREMRYALVSYLTLVALHRAAGLAMGAALRTAAASSSSRTFRRIRDRIDRSARAGESAWVGLADLASELGIDELSDIAAIADTAGTQGAGVYMTLMARASSLRRELQKAEETLAAQSSTKLAIPRVLLAFATFAFLLFPALMSLASA